MLCTRLAPSRAFISRAARATMPRMKSDIVVIGASVMDMVAYVDKMPAISETVLGNSFGMSFGGKGANQAVCAAKLGAKVTMITKLGQDAIGDNYVENYKVALPPPSNSRAATPAAHCH